MPTLRGWGHVGIVYDLTDHIVVKRRSLHDEEEAFLNEIRIFDMLESRPPVSQPCSKFLPDLIRQFPGIGRRQPRNKIAAASNERP